MDKFGWWKRLEGSQRDVCLSCKNTTTNNSLFWASPLGPQKQRKPIPDLVYHLFNNIPILSFKVLKCELIFPQILFQFISLIYAFFVLISPSIYEIHHILSRYSQYYYSHHKREHFWEKYYFYTVTHILLISSFI